MTMMQIRNVPEDVHRRLKSRAALLGMSLSDYALSELERTLERPTRAELLERLQARTPRKFRVSPTEIIRRDRDRHAGR